LAAVAREEARAGAVGSADAAAVIARSATTIPEAVVAAARAAGSKAIACEDATTGQLTYRRLTIGAAVLAAKFAAFPPAERNIGVMLPTSNAAALTLLGLMSAGRVPALINFTAGIGNLTVACRSAELATIVTARAFIEKAGLGALVDELSRIVRIVFLEDIRKSVGIVDKLRGALGAHRPLVKRRPDDPAAIVFTSGSEGQPRGVVLSHRNILANTAQGGLCLQFGSADRLFSALPVFHAFGLSIGLVLPLASGVRVFLYPSPLHYRIIPEIIRDWGATILLGTNTFLAGYGRAAGDDDFRTLRLIVAGAEPLRTGTRNVYAARFGRAIHEGYGVTEAAPALCFNTLSHNREGTVGRLLPAIEARLEAVAGVDGGRLFVRGPNVMLGYLDAHVPGRLEPPPGGWHDTGDIVEIDADGYVTIRGRARRFAKIGSEMVSLAALEALAADLWPDAMSVATAIADNRRGERLVIVTDDINGDSAEFAAFARRRGASSLVAGADVIVVPELPLLGAGKIDHQAVRDIAARRLAAAAAG